MSRLSTESVNPHKINPADDKDFIKSLEFDLIHEGKGFENIPGDSGGPTRSGITWIDGNIWRKEHHLPELNIKEAASTRLRYLTPKVIQEIYYQHYWVPLRAAKLPNPLNEILFDGAVNMGTSREVKMLQAVLGVHQTGKFDTNTQTALDKYLKTHGQLNICEELLERRRTFYHHIGVGHNHKFLEGWLARVDDLQKIIDSKLGSSE